MKQNTVQYASIEHRLQSLVQALQVHTNNVSPLEMYEPEKTKQDIPHRRSLQRLQEKEEVTFLLEKNMNYDLGAIIAEHPTVARN